MSMISGLTARPFKKPESRNVRRRGVAAQIYLDNHALSPYSKKIKPRWSPADSFVIGWEGGSRSFPSIWRRIAGEGSLNMERV
jgi:hypothetical protein